MLVDATDGAHQAAEKDAGRRVLERIRFQGERADIAHTQRDIGAGAHPVQDGLQLLEREIFQQAKDQAHAERAGAGQRIDAFAVLLCVGADTRRRARVDKCSQVFVRNTVQMDVLVLDEVCDHRTEVTIDENDARLAFILMEMADDLDQRFEFARGGAGQLVQNQQAAALVELLKDADAPTIFARAREGCAQHRVEGAHDVVEAKRAGAGRADLDDAVAEVVVVVVRRGYGQRALAVALLAADGNCGQVIAAGEPVVKGQQVAAAANKAVEPIVGDIVGRRATFHD